MIVSLRKYRVPILVLAMIVWIAATLPANGKFESLSELGINELRIESSLLDVEVYGTPGLLVDIRGEEIPDNVVVEYRRQGGLLHVWVEKKFTLFPQRKNGKLVCSVPRGTELNVASSSGTVSVQDVNPDSLRVRSSSGSVRLSSIRGITDVESSSGSLFLDRMQGQLRAQSSSGRIEVTVLDGDITASASSGSVRLSRIDGDIDVSSSSGRIELDATRGTIRAETSSGGVYGDNIWITNDSIFKTSSGKIDIDLANPLSVFEFRLSGSSGGLRAGDITGKKHLEVGTGSILITGSSSSGSQRYR